MRIAFFGGSFDPPHHGHLAIAHAAMERLHLDEVLFAPVGLQPLKREAQPASFQDRAEMVRLAIEDDPRLRLSLADAPRTAPNYTIDTLLELRATLAADDRLFFLVGADSFLTLHKWHRAAELLFVCDFIVAGRPGSPIGRAALPLPDGVSAEAAVSCGPGCIAYPLRDTAGHSGTLYLLPGLHEDVSATEIRRALAGGGEPQSALRPEVVTYIRQHGLYRLAWNAGSPSAGAAPGSRS